MKQIKYEKNAVAAFMDELKNNIIDELKNKIIDELKNNIIDELKNENNR